MQIRLYSLVLILALVKPSARMARTVSRTTSKPQKHRPRKKAKTCCWILPARTGAITAYSFASLKCSIFREFIKGASKSFVLVELDFPNYKDQSDALKKQNQDLRRDFEISGYPTIFLCDAKGRPYARTGYRPGGPEAFLKALDELRPAKASRDDLLEDAAKATGAEKAKLLDRTLQVLEAYGVTVGNDDMVHEIVEADKRRRGGTQTEIRTAVEHPRRAEHRQRRRFRRHANMKLDTILKNENLKPDHKQGVYYLKAQIFAAKKDKSGILATLKLAQLAAPETPVGRELATLIPELEKQYATGQ